MKKGTLVLCLLFSALLLYSEVSTAKRNYLIDIVDINVTDYEKSFIKDIHYEIHPYNLVHSVSFELTLLRELRYFRMRIKFDMIRRDNTKINVMNFNEVGCRILDGSKTNNLVRPTFDEFRRIGNIPDKCPLPAKKYHFKNYTINANAYPSILPSMNWILTLQGWQNETLFIELYIKGKTKQL